MVHKLIYFNDEKSEKQRDITGARLKKIIAPNNLLSLNDFSDFSDLRKNRIHIFL